MTDRETDELLRRALLDALRDEWAETPEDKTPPSPRQQRRMRAMLADPKGYCRRQGRPLWRRAARTAASFLLVCTASLALMMAVSPDIRAGVLRWAREVREDSVFYRFAGEDMEADGLRYTLVKLPDGYVKTEDRTEERGFFRVTYQNGQGQEIVLSCADPEKGAALAPDMAGREPAEEIALSQGTGQWYPAQTAEDSAALVWLEEGCQFMLEAPVDRATLEDLSLWIFPELPRYQLSELPEGVVPYAEMPINEGPNSVDLLYVDEDGSFFSLAWVYMQQGSGVGLFGGTGGDMHSREVTVGGLPGQCYWSDGDDFPSLVWIDEERNLLFTMTGRTSEEELLRLAEGVVPVD